MKYLLTLVTLLFIGFSSIELYAQGPNYLSGLKPIQFDDIKGMEITITDLKDENRTFYYEVPDTLWIKESKKPLLNKHYKIIYIQRNRI